MDAPMVSSVYGLETVIQGSVADVAARRRHVLMPSPMETRPTATVVAQIVLPVSIIEAVSSGLIASLVSAAPITVAWQRPATTALEMGRKLVLIVAVAVPVVKMARRVTPTVIARRTSVIGELISVDQSGLLRSASMS